MGGGPGKEADTGCYNFASIMDILDSQGMDLSKPILFSNKVEVGDGFHFYYNKDKESKLATAETYNIPSSTNFESKNAVIVEKEIINSKPIVRKTHKH